MQIIIKSRHTVIPNRLRAFATQKFERLEKLLDRIQTIEIAVGESGARRVTDKSVVEVTLVTKLRRLHAEAHGPDIMTAVEAAVAKVESQVRKLKGKAMARTRRNGGHAVADRLAAVAALNGAADAAAKISGRAGVASKERAPAKAKAVSSKAGAKKATGKAATKVAASKRSASGTKRAAAAKTTAERSPRRSPAKRAMAGSKGR